MITRKHGPGALLVALFGLGACGGGSGGNVAMEPGEWETTAELTRVDVGNLPEEMRRNMRMPSSRTTTTRGCWVMTADRVRIENLRFTVPEPVLRGAGCTLPELVLEGGTLRGRMRCTGIPAPPMAGGARTMSISGELDGSYTPDSVRATARGEIRFGEHSGSVEVRITSRRIGACPPRPSYAPPAVPRDWDGDAQSARDAVNQAARDAQSAREAVNQAAGDARADMAR
jgi:hypothetical protein